MASILAIRDIYLSSNIKAINNGIRYHDSTAKFNNQFFLYSLFDHKTKRDFKTNISYYIMVIKIQKMEKIIPMTIMNMEMMNILNKTIRLKEKWWSVLMENLPTNKWSVFIRIKSKIRIKRVLNNWKGNKAI